MTKEEYDNFTAYFKRELAYTQLFHVANRLATNARDIDRIVSELTTVSILTKDDDVASDILRLSEIMKTLHNYTETMYLCIDFAKTKGGIK